MKTVGITLSAIIVLFVAFKHLRVFENHSRENTSSIDVDSGYKASAINSPGLELDIAENDEQEPEFEEDFDIVDIDDQEFEEGYDIADNAEYESEIKGRSFFRR
jgi:hypothetical protein